MADKERENPISAETADALIAAHDSEAALYCLYISRHPEADDERAAAVLCRTRAEIAAAREKLGRILNTENASGAKAVLYPEEEPVQYGKEEIARRAEREKAFGALCDELARILGTIPSQAYLNALLDAYDHLGMPPEVIMQLLHFCDEEAHRLWGSGRRPSAKFISEEAYRWANREILTLELADEYIARRAKQREDKQRILAMLGIRGREPSPSENKYMDAWLEMGFSDETIALALDRTLTNTGALKWPYMNGILKNWHAKGLHSLADVEQAEGKRKTARQRPGVDPIDEEELEETLKRILGDKA